MRYHLENRRTKELPKISQVCWGRVRIVQNRVVLGNIHTEDKSRVAAAAASKAKAAVAA